MTGQSYTNVTTSPRVTLTPDKVLAKTVKTSKTPSQNMCNILWILKKGISSSQQIRDMLHKNTKYKQIKAYNAFLIHLQLFNVLRNFQQILYT
jgi:hypothetical protein